MSPRQQQPSSSSMHGIPPEGWECLVTMEDITPENYVEYQCYPSLLWRPAKMEQCVIEQLLQTQFHAYIERVHKTDCQAELKRLLQHGPPIYIADPHGLPLRAADDDDNIGNDKDDQNNDKKKQHQPQDTHIIQLWFASDDTERSAKLHGAVEGEERERLWKELREFIIVEGKEQGDDDDDNDYENG